VSKILKVYQTLKNKDNPKEVESEGPFDCNWSNAWLGEGFYFWEAFINSAHWWGKTHCHNNYFICEANCTLTDTNCFDLVGDSKHMSIFSDAVEEMKVQGIINKKTTVTRILQYLKDDIKVFKFEATRAVGYTSIGEKKNIKYVKKLLFEVPKQNKQDHYLHYMPPIQICFYGKEAMNLNGYKIIYPDEYNNDYVL
jgi:hypothetical protein